MNDFKRLNELAREQKARINALYNDLDSPLIEEALSICSKICGRDFKDKSFRVAIAARIASLKPDPLENELKKLGVSENLRILTRDAMFDYARKIYEARHAELISKARDERVLDEFFQAVLEGMHETGLAMNAWQMTWQARIIDDTNKKFERKFSNLSEASEFILKNGLYQTDENGERADRSYGAVEISQNLSGEIYSFVPYALAFKDEVKAVNNALSAMISRLEKLKNAGEAGEILSGENSDEILAQRASYIAYFKALKEAFSKNDNARVIPAWQAAEISWMEVKGALQPGHPLEYYEDAYTHAVALEWDVRLTDTCGVNEREMKDNIARTYKKVCERIGAASENFAALHKQVLANVERTQLYVSVPMIYYGAELNGLFSAQVVPNDESVSARCGKKIFAFVNHVYEAAKAKPFSRLSSEIFELDFLNIGREILFLKPEIWRKIYEISTIGHEFGHILFIGSDTENAMNKSGAFKFIEEYKATTGGLVNFFFHEDARYKKGVFAELISRSVGLIGWKNVGEVRAYYCEGIIHLSLLFSAGALKFNGEKLIADTSEAAYERFKDACLENYFKLARHNAAKHDAREFLERFCVQSEGSYLPVDAKTREFTEFYYERFEAMGNELDASGEWERWREKSGAAG